MISAALQILKNPVGANTGCKRLKNIRSMAAVVVISASLGACNFMNQTVNVTAPGFAKEIQEKMPSPKGIQGADYHLVEGLKALSTGASNLAYTQFNRGLKFDPQHPHLHFFNALIYHQRTNAGNAAQFDLAEVGYKLALKFEPDHWLAAYQLGKLYMNQDQYRRAQTEFSRALRIEPRNPSVAYGLAVASYAVGDAKTAHDALNNLPSIYQNYPDVLRANSLTWAALDDVDTARQFLDRYGASGADSWRVKQVSRRLDAWESYHRQKRFRLAQVEQPDSGMPDFSTSPEMNDNTGQDPNHEAPIDQEMGSSELRQNMVILDAVILNQEKSNSSQTGVNLLSGLKVMFSGNILDYARSRTKNMIDNGSSTSTRQNNNSLTIALPAVTYSLNIANAQDSTNELLARPSVLAYEGTESELFIGTEVTYTTPGDNGGSSYNKEIGLSLKVLPEFGSDELIKLSVQTEFDSVAPTAAPGSFSQALATVKVRTHAVSELQFGQTMVIGAGTSKQISRGGNGVPVLQDIPVLKNLFNVDTTSDRETSIIVLITPRKPVSLDQKSGKLDNFLSRQESAANANSLELQALRSRHKDWWRPTSNTLKALDQLGETDLLKEFRRGDLKFIDLDENLSTRGDGQTQGPKGIIRALVDAMYF